MTDTTPAVEPFKREERFIVVKRKNLSGYQEDRLRDHFKASQIPTVECVVVESDWPEYETVWKMIEARVTGKTDAPCYFEPSNDERAQWPDATSQYVQALEEHRDQVEAALAQAKAVKP